MARIIRSFHQSPPETSQLNFIPWLPENQGDTKFQSVAFCEGHSQPAFWPRPSATTRSSSALPTSTMRLANRPRPRERPSSPRFLMLRDRAKPPPAFVKALRVHWELFACATVSAPHSSLLDCDYRRGLLRQRLAGNVFQADHRPVEALADAMDEIAAGKYEHRV